jgi:ABC-type multidrug transport system fused ATPase/permease subunit
MEQSAINNVSKGRTTITVAHNVNVIRDCDLIHTFEGGEVQESGTHTELVGVDGGLYNRLFSEVGAGAAPSETETTETTSSVVAAMSELQ